MSIRWDEITYDHLYGIESVFKLYDQTFPIEERESHKIFWKGLEYAKTRMPNNFHFLVGFEGKKLISFATGHYFSDINSGFIVYIAVEPNMRSHGVGSKTLLKFEELLNKDAMAAGHTALKAIILETEIQALAYTESEIEVCSKRNRFYERNNFQLFDNIHYIQPPLHQGGSPLPLNLFVKNLHQIEITEKDIPEFIRAMYKEKYYLVNEIDKSVLRNCLGKMGIDHEGLFDLRIHS